MAAFRPEEVQGSCDLNCFLDILTSAEGNISRFDDPAFWHKSGTFLLLWAGISFVDGHASALNR